MDEGIDRYYEFAKALARRAGSIIHEEFNRGASVKIKDDGSLVTEVDERINHLVASGLSETFPTHGLLGEEGNSGTGKEEYLWICDPIDGTKPFILGVPNCVFMIALLRQRRAVLSVVYDPFSESLYHAIRGKGAYCNDERIRVSDEKLRDNFVVLGTGTYPFVPWLKNAKAILEPVSGSGYKSMMIAQGRAVATLRDKADFHDVAPSALIIEEAGGRVTDLNGKPLQLDRPIEGVIMSNSAAHNELLDVVRCCREADFQRKRPLVS